MTEDKHAERRYELDRAVLHLDSQEEEMDYLRRSFERSLDAFEQHFHHLSFQEEQFFYQSGSSAFSEEEQERWAETNRMLKGYIDRSIQAVSALCLRSQERYEQERERLLKERNSLPWE